LEIQWESNMNSLSGAFNAEEMERALGRLSGAKTRSRIGFADGTTLSAQANEYTYCFPRTNAGPWESVEVGMPNREIAELMPMAEDASDPTGTVYGRVPVELLAWLAAACGGRIDRQEEWSERGLGGAVFNGGASLGAQVGKERSVAFEELAGAARSWCQAVVLHSPNEELRHRFSIQMPNGGLRIEWRDVLACLALAGYEEGRSLAQGWSSKILERAELMSSVAIPLVGANRATRSI
jgi:hypothetical protein